MSDLHARERQDPEWGRPVADLIEEDEVVGLAYEDEGELLVGRLEHDRPNAPRADVCTDHRTDLAGERFTDDEVLLQQRPHRLGRANACQLRGAVGV